MGDGPILTVDFDAENMTQPLGLLPGVAADSRMLAGQPLLFVEQQNFTSNSYEIKGFVEPHLCRLCVISDTSKYVLRSRVLRGGVCPREGYMWSTPLVLASTSILKVVQRRPAFHQSARGSFIIVYNPFREGQTLTAVEKRQLSILLDGGCCHGNAIRDFFLVAKRFDVDVGGGGVGDGIVAVIVVVVVVLSLSSSSRSLLFVDIISIIIPLPECSVDDVPIQIGYPSV